MTDGRYDSPIIAGKKTAGGRGTRFLSGIRREKSEASRRTFPSRSGKLDVWLSHEATKGGRSTASRWRQEGTLSYNEKWLREGWEKRGQKP